MILALLVVPTGVAIPAVTLLVLLVLTSDVEGLAVMAVGGVLVALLAVIVRKGGDAADAQMRRGIAQILRDRGASGPEEAGSPDPSPLPEQAGVERPLPACGAPPVFLPQTLVGAAVPRPGAPTRPHR